VLEPLIARLADGSLLGPLLGLAVGALLGLSPVALPTIPAVLATVSRGYVYDSGYRLRTPVSEAFPSILAFTAGMNGVIGLAGYAFVTVTVGLARAAVALHLVAAVAMVVLGLRLVTRRASVCGRPGTIPPHPGRAFLYGVGFSIGGCPGCGPVALAVGSAAALVGGPLYGLLIIATFVLGHATVLLGVAAIGSRLLPNGHISWLRLDLLVGGLLLAGAGYYVYAIATGAVTTVLPGEPGSAVLP
jgi:cytochrome c biogenesis protein CcdA